MNGGAAGICITLQNVSSGHSTTIQRSWIPLDSLRILRRFTTPLKVARFFGSTALYVSLPRSNSRRDKITLLAWFQRSFSLSGPRKRILFARLTNLNSATSPSSSTVFKHGAAYRKDKQNLGWMFSRPQNSSGRICTSAWPASKRAIRMTHDEGLPQARNQDETVERAVFKARGWSIQRDEGRDASERRGVRGCSFSRWKINRACMCKRHFRRPRDSRSKSARSASRRRNEQPGQILQRGRTTSCPFSPFPSFFHF